MWLSVDPLAEKFAGWSSYNYCFNNPVKFVDPDGMDPTKDEAKAMSDHVYTGKEGDVIKGNWLLKTRYDDQASGLNSALYQREMSNGEYEYCYANAGSIQGVDWKNNATQLIGKSDQYQKSLDRASILAKDPNIGKNLSFTGHSLGGGLAAANAYKTGKNAYIFNPARLSIATYNQLNVSMRNKANIYSFIEFLDPLNAVQSLDLLIDNPVMNPMPRETKQFELHTLNIMKGHDIKTMRGKTVVQKSNEAMVQYHNARMKR